MSRTYQALKKAEQERVRTGQPAAARPADGRRPPQVVWGANGHSRLEYERIRVWITNPAAHGARIQTLMIVACHPESGTTTTAALLASSLAESKRSRVLLVDANFRTPCLDVLFGVANKVGLTEVLAEEHPVADDVQATGRDNLFVLTTGRVAPVPSDLFGRSTVDTFMNDLKSRFDYIVFDAAPVLDFPDSCALAPRVDATLLVVEADRTPVADAQRAKRELERAGARLLGVVLNRHRDYTPRFLRGLLGTD